jgi:purine-nucleoside phosphorylase
MSGRVHLYEGYSPEQVVFGVRVMCQLGAGELIVTNAAGGVNPSFAPGTLMLMSDHVNLTGRNPLIGPNDLALGLRFPDMTHAYSSALRAQARRAAEEVGVAVAEGVYLAWTGPSFETPAEIRLARTVGADAVGMSTVLEVIAARHLGMRVLGISCITNLAAGITDQTLSEGEVLATAAQVRDQFVALLRAILRHWEPAGDPDT